MKVYCNKIDCPHHKCADNSQTFQYSKYYVPFPGGAVAGECCLRGLKLFNVSRTFGDISDSSAVCSLGERIADKMVCKKDDCLWNNKSICLREDILIGKSLISGDWICKCFSNKKISGHIDFMNLVDSSGHPHGGSIDDSYANRMAEDKKKSRSYSDHTRQMP